MKHGNLPGGHHRVVGRFSPEAVKAFEIFGCTEERAHFPCLPVDRNRIVFVTCKKSYKNKKRYYNWHAGEYYNTTYGESYRGDNEFKILCPTDCAIRGSAYDGGKRYNEIKEHTKRIKLRRRVTLIPYPDTFLVRVWNWFGVILC